MKCQELERKRGERNESGSWWAHAFLIFEQAHTIFTFDQWGTFEKDEVLLFQSSFFEETKKIYIFKLKFH